MAWADAVRPGLRVTSSPSESGVIADSVFHLWVGKDTQPDVGGIASALRSCEDAALVIVRFDPSLDWVPAALLSADRIALPAGTLMYWHDPTPLSGGHAAADTLRSALEDEGLVCSADSARARRAFREIFDGYRNHYSANPFLHPVALGHAYGDWASRLSASPEHVVVLSPGPARNEPAGAALLSCRQDHVEVLLAGIRPAWRSQGGYSFLLGAIARAVRAAGAGPLVISTQSHNVAVQRLWARLGLEPVLSVEIVHSMHPRITDRAS